MEKLSSFISWKLLKIALQNEKWNPQMTAISDFFSKNSVTFIQFLKKGREATTLNSPPPIPTPPLFLKLRACSIKI